MTSYWWKKKLRGLGATELRRLKELKEDNRKPEQRFADLNLGSRDAAGCADTNAEPFTGRPRQECSNGAW